MLFPTLKSFFDNLEERIKTKIIVTDAGCWLWEGSCDTAGYPQLSVHGKSRILHRVIAYRYTGISAVEYHHTCEIKRCINPEHLLATTRKDHPGLSGKNKTHCLHGHLLSGPNLNLYRGRRYCKACARKRASWYYALYKRN